VKQIRKRITYANVMSSIAVFLVLGGGAAYAAKKIGSNEIKGNSITTGKLKKNAVTASKIKSNSITTAKIKNGAVTGSKVNVGTLGTVPNATHATNADNATNWSRYLTTGIVKASAGQNVSLFNIGPFSVVGHCKDLGSGKVEASMIITTSQVGSSMSAYENEYYKADFNPGLTPEIGYTVSGTTPESNDSYGGGSYYNAFSAASADGKTLISGQGTSAVYYYGAQCAFWAHAVNNA
jgi:hypothetical protein